MDSTFTNNVRVNEKGSPLTLGLKDEKSVPVPFVRIPEAVYARQSQVLIYFGAKSIRGQSDSWGKL